MLGLLMLVEGAATTTRGMPAFLARLLGGRERAEQSWTEECWTSARGGLMIGSGRDGKGDSVRHWEWMRIERGTDGSVTFYGSPKGAAAGPVARQRRSGGNSITFVNGCARLSAARPLHADRATGSMRKFRSPTAASRTGGGTAEEANSLLLRRLFVCAAAGLLGACNMVISET